MPKFLKYIVGWLVLVVLILEVTLRVFNLAAKTMPTVNLDNDYVFEPNSSGVWIRGGLGELKNYYQINNQGYNSIVNYDSLNSQNLNIAIIGDSYIQGFQSDVRKSIGRQLELLLDSSKTTVHEFGRAGANIVDYQLVYEKLIQSRDYDYVFILATDKDMKNEKASYMGRGNRVPKKTISRKVYDNFYLLRYFNINQGLGTHFNNLISNGPESIDRIQNKAIVKPSTKEEYLKSNNKTVINKLSNNIIFLHEDDKLSEFFIENFDFNFVKINHKFKPYTHGFDSHWNETGRYNCARSMYNFILENQNINKAHSNNLIQDYQANF